MVYRAPYSDYFHTDTKVFPAVEFLVEVLQHLPDSRQPTHSHLRAVLLSGSRHVVPSALTWSASLPRAGSATIHPSHPSASVRPRSRSPSCPCRPSRAAPPGPA